MKKTKRQLLQKACPAIFGKLPPNEVTPRYVSFQVPPEIFGPLRKWLDQHLQLEVLTGANQANCQIYILNTEAVHEYNKGRDPNKGYPKSAGGE
jgi:hypothetical protein